MTSFWSQAQAAVRGTEVFDTSVMATQLFGCKFWKKKTLINKSDL